MAEKTTDILMMITKNGNGIPAECSATIDTTDPMMKGFVDGQFFEIDDFDFGISLTDSDESTKQRTPQQGGAPVPQAAPKTGGRFSKWIQGLGATAYTIEMEPFGFSKQIGTSSIPLFYSCFQTKSFDSATVVMRKSGGVFDSDTGLAAVPFLRIDFNAVLIVALDWDGGEIVKEKCKFVCRKVAVQYCQQWHDGTPFSPLGGDFLSLQKAT
jgi:type VI protein secretion system component Hcp